MFTYFTSTNFSNPYCKTPNFELLCVELQNLIMFGIYFEWLANSESNLQLLLPNYKINFESELEFLHKHELPEDGPPF